MADARFASAWTDAGVRLDLDAALEIEVLLPRTENLGRSGASYQWRTAFARASDGLRARYATAELVVRQPPVALLVLIASDTLHGVVQLRSSLVGKIEHFGRIRKATVRLVWLVLYGHVNGVDVAATDRCRRFPRRLSTGKH
jgi:hypothetical protein